MWRTEYGHEIGPLFDRKLVRFVEVKPENFRFKLNRYRCSDESPEAI